MNLRTMITSILILAAAWIIPSRTAAQCGGTWSLRTPATSPSARSLQGMVFDSVRKVSVLFGGQLVSTADGETWEWDGATWTNKSPATAPTPRYGYGMAYDSKRKVTVLFGGYDGTTYFGDTWEWNGSQWTQKTPADSPAARYLSTMAYDSDRGVTVLFAGFDGATILFDTWEWDGTNWTNKSVSPHPAARAGHSMAYDSARHETVLFGGLLTAVPPSFSSETWVWNGTSWSQVLSVETPAARYAGAMAYDSVRERTQLFGGVISIAGGTAEIEGKSWEWDGASWTEQVPGASPADRAGSAMTYDSARSVTVQFGGVVIGGSLMDTWEWSIPSIQISQQPAAQSVADGASAIFTVAANSGPIELSYAWRKDGTALADGGSISGATTATLTINPVSATDAGAYDVQVSHACQTIVSQSASLNISSSGAASDTSALTAAPCGVCGGGAAAMMPLALLGLTATKLRRRS